MPIRGPSVFSGKTELELSINWKRLQPFAEIVHLQSLKFDLIIGWFAQPFVSPDAV